MFVCLLVFLFVFLSVCDFILFVSCLENWSLYFSCVRTCTYQKRVLTRTLLLKIALHQSFTKPKQKWYEFRIWTHFYVHKIRGSVIDSVLRGLLFTILTAKNLHQKQGTAHPPLSTGLITHPLTSRGICARCKILRTPKRSVQMTLAYKAHQETTCDKIWTCVSRYKCWHCFVFDLKELDYMCYLCHIIAIILRFKVQ